MVNNAGVVDTTQRIDEQSLARWQRMFAINVTGSFLCAREAVKRMSTRHGGAMSLKVNGRAAHTDGAYQSVEGLIAGQTYEVSAWVHYRDLGDDPTDFAVVLLDACVRLLPGVVGAEASLTEESFERGLLEKADVARSMHSLDRSDWKFIVGKLSFLNAENVDRVIRQPLQQVRQTDI